METAKTATLTLDSVKRETAEAVTAVILKLMNVNEWIVVNVEFVKKMFVLTSTNFVPRALNVRIKSVSLQLNAAMKSLVVPVRIAKMEPVWTEIVDFAVIAIL